MLPIVIIFLSLVFLMVMGCLVFMFANVLRDGPPARLQFNDRLSWRTPIIDSPRLKAWATRVSKSTTQKLLSRRLTESTPIRLAEEVLQGTSFAVQQLPYLAVDADRGTCPNRGGERLGVTVPEVLAIADKVRSDKSEASRVHAAAIRNLGWLAEYDEDKDQAPTLACPLLTDDGHCAACGLRPVQCRTSFHSLDLLPKSYAATLEESARQLGTGVEAGLSQGLDAAGLDGNQYELNSALAVALDTPDASERWSKGEDVFSQCTRYECSAHAD
jgi:Fe-S-cluster containining protein